jgi:hypothetical protein
MVYIDYFLDWLFLFILLGLYSVCVYVLVNSLIVHIGFSVYSFPFSLTLFLVTKKLAFLIREFLMLALLGGFLCRDRCDNYRREHLEMFVLPSRKAWKLSTALNINIKNMEPTFDILQYII